MAAVGPGVNLQAWEVLHTCNADLQAPPAAQLTVVTALPGSVMS